MPPSTTVSLTALQVLLEEQESRWAPTGPLPSWSSWLGDVTLLAQQVSGMPFAFVSVLDVTRTTYLAVRGIDLDPVPREQSVCDLVVSGRAPLVLPDVADRPDLAHLPHVQAGLRAYAGVPVGDGGQVGFALCVADTSPRPDLAEALPALEALARLALRGLAA